MKVVSVMLVLIVHGNMKIAVPWTELHNETLGDEWVEVEWAYIKVRSQKATIVHDSQICEINMFRQKCPTIVCILKISFNQ